MRSSPSSARAARGRRRCCASSPGCTRRMPAACSSTASTSRGTPPHLRGIGLVFQDHALFPHRDVASNVGLRAAHARRSAGADCGADGRAARARRADGVRTPVGRIALGGRAAARRARARVGTRATRPPSRRAARLARSPAPRPAARRPRTPVRRARRDGDVRHPRPDGGVHARGPRCRDAQRAASSRSRRRTSSGRIPSTRTSRASSVSPTSTGTRSFGRRR